MRSYIPAAGWALFILFATISNVSTLRDLNLEDLFTYDKPVHMILFGIQAWLLVRGARQKGFHYSRMIFLCCFSSAVYGGITEFLQGFLTTTRSFDYFDMIADAAGCLIVYLWFALIRK